MEDLEFRIVEHGTRECDELVNLRSQVLRIPLGLSFTEEQLAAEADQIHIGVYVKGQLAGCLLLAPQSKHAVKMRQVAIAPESQGRGLGRNLVEYAEQLAQQRGFREIVLSARESALQFYLTLEYETFGGPFTEVTGPHRSMRKSLRY